MAASLHQGAALFGFSFSAGRRHGRWRELFGHVCLGRIGTLRSGMRQPRTLLPRPEPGVQRVGLRRSDGRSD